VKILAALDTHVERIQMMHPSEKRFERPADFDLKEYVPQQRWNGWAIPASGPESDRWPAWSGSRLPDGFEIIIKMVVP